MLARVPCAPKNRYVLKGVKMDFCMILACVSYFFNVSVFEIVFLEVRGNDAGNFRNDLETNRRNFTG